MKTGTVEFYMQLDYPVELRAIPKDMGGGYYASIPYLGRDAFLADGDTVEEALEQLEEVKFILFKDMIESGREIPLPPPLSENDIDDYSGRLPLRIPKELHKRIAERAKANECSINQYIAVVLSEKVGIEESSDKVEEAVARALRSYASSGVYTAEHVRGRYKVNKPQIHILSQMDESGPGSQDEDDVSTSHRVS